MMLLRFYDADTEIFALQKAKCFYFLFLAQNFKKLTRLNTGVILRQSPSNAQTRISQSERRQGVSAAFIFFIAENSCKRMASACGMFLINRKHRFPGIKLSFCPSLAIK